MSTLIMDDNEKYDFEGKYTSFGDIVHMKFHDILGYSLFIVAIGVTIGVFAHTSSQVQVIELFHPRDYKGRYCGFDNRKLDVFGSYNYSLLVNFKNYKYTFYELDSRNVICVKSCPKCDKYSDCTRVDTDPSYGLGETVEGYATTRTGSICATEDDSYGISVAYAISSFINDIYVCCYAAKTEISLFSLLSIVLTCAICGIMSYYAKAYVYAMMGAIPLIIAAFGIFLYIVSESGLGYDINEEVLIIFKVLAIFLWCVALVLILIIIFLSRKVNQVVMVIELALYSFSRNVYVVLYPFISLISLMVIYSTLGFTLLFYESKADIYWMAAEDLFKPVYDNSNSDIYFFVVLFSVLFAFFLSYAKYASISASIVNWYFNKDKSGVWTVFLHGAFVIPYVKQCGSIMIMSLFSTALFLVIKLVQAYVRRVAKKGSCIAKFLASCLSCCMSCILNIYRYTSKVTLTFQQIMNVNWYEATCKSVDILTKEVLFVSLLNGVSCFVLGITKFFIVSVVTVTASICVNNELEDLGITIIATLVVFILSYVFTTVLLGTLSDIIDIVFSCLLFERYSGLTETLENDEVKVQVHRLEDINNETKTADTYVPLN